MLSPPASEMVGASLLTLVSSSASVRASETRVGRTCRGCAGAREAASSRESLPKAWAWVLVMESCVVALETSCGRDGARLTECEDAGRDGCTPSCSCGRGGSGGGVPSLDGEVEVVAPLVLYEGLREDEALRAMMLSVGLAKSSCSTRSLSPSFAGVGASPSLGDGWFCGAAFPDSDMEKAGGLSHEA